MNQHEEEVEGAEEESEGEEVRERDDDQERPQSLRRRRQEEEHPGLLIQAVSAAAIYEFAPLYLASFEHDGHQVGEGILRGALHEVALGLQQKTIWLYGAWAWERRFAPPMGMLEVRKAWGAPYGHHYQVFRLYVKPAERYLGVAHALVRDALLALPDEDAIILFSYSGGEELPRSYARLSARPVAMIALGSLKAAKAKLRRSS